MTKSAGDGAAPPNPVPDEPPPVAGAIGATRRLQPLLLAGSAVAVFPLVVSSAADRPWVAVFVAAIAIAAGTSWWAIRMNRLPEPVARWLPLVCTIVAFAGLALVLAAVEPQHVRSFVPVVVALSAALSTTPGRMLRWIFQIALLALVGISLWEASSGPGEIAFVTLLIAAVIVVAEVFTRELRRTRTAEVEARRAAERRAELLWTARGLPGQSVQAAAEAVTRTLRELAFDAAGVAKVGPDGLVGVYMEGIPAATRPIPPGTGVAWEAIERDETIVLEDYQRSDNRMPERPTIHSTVVTPIRVDGAAVGTVMCARRIAAPPTEAEVEIAEVLADHLSGVFAAEERQARQRQLLERVEELDRMRTGLVSAVSAELRDPLTIVRGISSILRVHGDRLAPAERRAFLERLGAQTQDLRRVVDAILDFSRLQSRRDDAVTSTVVVAELLVQMRGDHQVEFAPPVDQIPRSWQVEVDPVLLRFGLQLLAEPRLTPAGDVQPVRIGVTPVDEGIELVRRSDESPPISRLTLSLASQVLSAAGASVSDEDDPRVWLPTQARPQTTDARALADGEVG